MLHDSFESLMTLVETLSRMLLPGGGVVMAEIVHGDNSEEERLDEAQHSWLFLLGPPSV